MARDLFAGDFMWFDVMRYVVRRNRSNSVRGLHGAADVIGHGFAAVVRVMEYRVVLF